MARNLFVDYCDPSPHTNITVYEPDDGPRPTGVLDQHGAMIYRTPERIRMGFVPPERQRKTRGRR